MKTETWETWNYQLWIMNDEDLYNLGRRAYSPENLQEIFSEVFPETPDGARADSEEIDWQELYRGFNEH